MAIVSSPVLPQELLDWIIDFLHLDADALQSTSTVSRACLSSSWYHLFQSLTLHSVRLRKLNERPETSITFLPHVRNLRLLCVKFHMPWSNDDLGCLARLTAVESLSIRHVNWTCVSADTRHTILTNFKSLKALELWTMAFASFSDVVDIIATFQSLQYLSFREVSLDSQPRTKSDYVPPSLRSFSIVRGSMRNLVFTWLLENKQHLALNTLCLGSIIPREATIAGKLVKRLSSSLEHLEVSSDVNCGDILGQEINLGANVNLRTIRICRPIFYPSPSSNDRWELQLLSQIISPYLTEVTIAFRFSGPAIVLALLSNVAWDELERLLARPVFVFLQKFRIILDPPDNEVDVLKVICAKLPMCNARGILEVNMEGVLAG